MLQNLYFCKAVKLRSVEDKQDLSEKRVRCMTV